MSISMRPLFTILILSACGDNVAAPTLDAMVTIDSPDLTPCIVLGCPIPTCTDDACTCNGEACVPTGIPLPVSCADLPCQSLSCGMGDEEGICTCTLDDGTIRTCATP
jgi:hypothetical protein